MNLRARKPGRLLAACVSSGMLLSVACAQTASAGSAEPVLPKTSAASLAALGRVEQSALKSATLSDPADAWAKTQSSLVSISAGAGSGAAISGSRMALTLRNVRQAEVSSAADKTVAATATSAVAAWNNLGFGRRGMVLATTTSGEARRVPVIFGAASIRNGVITVVATPVGGTVPTIVRTKAQYPLYSVAKPAVRAESFRTATIVATSGNSQKWNFAASGTTAKVTVSGTTYTIVISGAGTYAAGVQPNRQSAATKVSDLQAHFASFAKGAKPRIVLSGTGTDAIQKAAVLNPTSVSVSGTTATIKGTLQSAATGWDKTKLATLRMPTVVFDTSNPGRTTSFVVVAGDSIASGEGGRFAGPYWADGISGGTTPMLSPDAQKGLIQFCGSVDLACSGTEYTGIKTPGVNGGAAQYNPLKYTWDLSRAYEEGSYGRFDPATKAYSSCHRAYDAPGTWLARYMKVVKKHDVESLNIACSGAKTDNIIDTEFKGEAPQAQQLKAIASWVPVPAVTLAIGANDIGFSTIATACYFTPIAQLAGVDPTDPDAISKAGAALSGGIDALIKGLPSIIDAQKYDKVSKKYVSWNPYFDDQKRCQNIKKTVNGKVLTLEQIAGAQILGSPENGIVGVAEKVKHAVAALHAAAPAAKIVHHNYPNLIPGQYNSLWDREKGWNAVYNLASQGVLETGGAIGDPTFAAFQPFDLSATGAAGWTGQQSSWIDPRTTGTDTRVDPLKPAGPENTKENVPLGIVGLQAISGKPMDLTDIANKGATYEVLRRLVWQEKDSVVWNPNSTDPGTGAPSAAKFPFYATVNLTTPYSLARQVIESLGLNLLPKIGAGQLMHFQDQNWAAQIAIPLLNSQVLAGSQAADPKGEFVIPVDLTEAFNGRELGSKFATTDPNWDNNNAWTHVVRDPATDESKLRTPFTVNLASGQGLPYLCPSSAELAMKRHDEAGSLIPDGKSQCIGSSQEALHPNWFGQAAEGQCLINVVFEGAAKGQNHCVRSVGDGTATSTPQAVSGVAEEQIVPVTGKDQLCLTSDYGVGNIVNRKYTACAAGESAMPTWDTERWARINASRTFHHDPGVNPTVEAHYGQWNYQ